MAESYTNGVENTVGKGGIDHYAQFLLFSQCFQNACFPGASKGVVVVWESVKELLTFTRQAEVTILFKN